MIFITWRSMTRTIFFWKLLGVSLNLALRATPFYPKEKSLKTFPGKVRGTRRCVRFQFALVMTMTTSHVGPRAQGHC